MMEPFHIGYMPRAVQRGRAMLEGRTSLSPKPPEAVSILGSNGKPMKRPVIQGWAALYDKAFQHSGRVVFLRSGCFISSIHDSQNAKRLLFDHNDSREVGSTNSGLEFANCLKGLAFRMPLTGNPSARQIADTVGNGDRACVSVGIRFTDYETREIEGFKVDIVSSAKLLECSLVSLGAIANTYARICDLEDDPEDLWFACRRAGFTTDQHIANMQASGRRIIEGLRKLVDR